MKDMRSCVFIDMRKDGIDKGSIIDVVVFHLRGCVSLTRMIALTREVIALTRCYRHKRNH